MGLIYNPSESQGLIAALNGNIGTAEVIIDNLNQASQHLTSALDTNALSGAAYTAGKGMFSQLVLPTISKASKAVEKLKTELQKYKDYDSAVGNEVLDEDKLNMQLQALKAQQSAITSQINSYNQLASAHPENSDLNTSYVHLKEQLSSYMSTVNDDIQKVEKKLEKLHEFNDNVNTLFTSSKEDFKAVMDMMSAFSSAEFDEAGNFTLNIKNNKELKRLKEIAGEVLEDLKEESITSLWEENITKAIHNKAKTRGKIAAEAIYKNRYSIKMANGKILGKTKGATAAAMKEAEDLASKSGKSLGRCVAGGFAVVGGIMDGYEDYQRDKSVGKAVIHGALSVGGSFVAAGVASFIPGPGWALAAGIVGGVIVGKGVDWLVEQKFVKDASKNVEKTVGKAIQGVTNFFGSVGKAFSW